MSSASARRCVAGASFFLFLAARAGAAALSPDVARALDVQVRALQLAPAAPDAMARELSRWASASPGENGDAAAAAFILQKALTEPAAYASVQGSLAAEPSELNRSIAENLEALNAAVEARPEIREAFRRRFAPLEESLRSSPSSEALRAALDEFWTGSTARPEESPVFPASGGSPASGAPPAWRLRSSGESSAWQLQPHVFDPNAKAGRFDFWELAFSWAPEFCRYKPDSPECQSLTADDFGAKNLTLHGLWPSVRGDAKHAYGYCGGSRADHDNDQSHDWEKLPPPPYSAATADALKKTMPGVAGLLDRHEWTRHGACSGLSADAYFSLASSFVERMSQGAFGRYLTSHVGETVDQAALRAVFEEDFGPGAADALILDCARSPGTPLSEVHLRLPRNLGNSPDLFKLPLESGERGNCPSSFKLLGR